MTVQKLSFGGKFKLIGFSGQTTRVREGPSARILHTLEQCLVAHVQQAGNLQKCKDLPYLSVLRILGLNLSIFLYTISKKYTSPLWIQRRVFEKKINGHQPQQRASMFQMDYCIDVQKRIAGKGVPYPPEAAAAAVASSFSSIHKTASVLCGRKHLLVVLLLNFLVKVSSIIIKFT